MAKDLRAVVGQIRDLPTLPQVVTTLLALMEDPESSAEDVNRVLERDPALQTFQCDLLRTWYLMHARRM